ncbi:MAG: hypothetical protein HY332_10920 [Chloroflexi bacterium]|nr:hypothetical protein [Chloroflexota bacterium]
MTVIIGRWRAIAAAATVVVLFALLALLARSRLAPPTGPGAGGPTVVTVPLAPLGGQLVTGWARLLEREEQIDVTVQLVGSVPEQTYQSAIHTGTCRTIGERIHRLTEMRADAEGNATAAAVVPAPLSSLTQGGIAVVVGAAPVQGVACGDMFLPFTSFRGTVPRWALAR